MNHPIQKLKNSISMIDGIRLNDDQHKYEQISCHFTIDEEHNAYIVIDCKSRESNDVVFLDVYSNDQSARRFYLLPHNTTIGSIYNLIELDFSEILYRIEACKNIDDKNYLDITVAYPEDRNVIDLGLN